MWVNITTTTFNKSDIEICETLICIFVNVLFIQLIIFISVISK